MFGYIYKTTNLINGRLYIGQTKGTFTPSYLGSGKTILKSIKKYGRNNFRLEVIAFATTPEMLDGLEQKFIFEYRQVFGKEFLYNITDGGRGVKGDFMNPIRSKIGHGNKGRKHTEEWKKEASKRMEGNKLWLGKHRTEDEKKRIGLAMKGRPSQYEMTNEIKNKIRNTVSKWAQENKDHYIKMRAKSSGMKGHKLSKESLQKIQLGRLKNWIIKKYNIQKEKSYA